MKCQHVWVWTFPSASSLLVTCAECGTTGTFMDAINHTCGCGDLSRPHVHERAS